MSEENNSGAWLGLGIGIGVIIGSFFVYVFLKSRQQPVPSVQMQTMQPPYLYVYQPQPPVTNVYPVIKEDRSLPTQGIHYQPQPTVTNVHPDIKDERIMTPSIQTQVIPSAPLAVPMEITAYKNNEQWEFERSENGFLKRINGIRDVKADVNTS